MLLQLGAAVLRFAGALGLPALFLLIGLFGRLFSAFVIIFFALINFGCRHDNWFFLVIETYVEDWLGFTKTRLSLKWAFVMWQAISFEPAYFLKTQIALACCLQYSLRKFFPGRQCLALFGLKLSMRRLLHAVCQREIGRVDVHIFSNTGLARTFSRRPCRKHGLVAK